jgi:sugar lactone lactonase YvrE
MTPPRSRKEMTIRNSKFALAASIFLLGLLGAILWYRSAAVRAEEPYRYVSTVAGATGVIGEPFGIAVNGTDIYVSDGQNGKILLVKGDSLTVFADGLDTPSGIAFDRSGNLLVADSGSNTIKSVDPTGKIDLLAGVEGRSGYTDGDSASALFDHPIGVAVGGDGRIFVADTYNDRIRLIENGKVSTLAGGATGYADGPGDGAKFDTPCGIAVWHDKLLVADTANRRLRVIEPTGRVWTLAGNGVADLKDGLPADAAFVEPTAVTVDGAGSVIIADGNAIRRIGGHTLPLVTTLSNERRGLMDGAAGKARFNRPSGLALDSTGSLLVADSENRLVRKFAARSDDHAITADEINGLRDRPEEFRAAQPGRWPFDPPTAKRDIAGTLGEVRGEVTDGSDQVWFHNGLDIAGAYGETARFIRDEKVLRPIAADNFGTLRELVRMPTIGYIHIRIGRNEASVPFGDARFQFARDKSGRMTGVRVPRGSKFAAGEPVGTLNSMNHVHLIAGRSGSEMNALDALSLPGVSDSRPPVIEKISLFDKDWREIETPPANSRISIRDRIRIVVRAFDQIDGNNERRRLGLYRLGYELRRGDAPVNAGPAAEIKFDRMPPNEAVKFAYAAGSRSGATGETIFNYIVTNSVEGEKYTEGFFDPSQLAASDYVLHIYAADYFGNITTRDISIEVIK